MKKPEVSKVIISCPRCKVYRMQRVGELLICPCGHSFPVANMGVLDVGDGLAAGGDLKC
jgi:hypothetical protein